MFTFNSCMCWQIAVLDNKQRESDRFLLVVKHQLVQAQQELFDDLVLNYTCFITLHVIQQPVINTVACN